MRNSIIDSAGDLVALEWSKLDRREERLWKLIDEWEHRERTAEPTLQLGQYTKGGGTGGDWSSESEPKIIGKRDVIQGGSIVALYSQLDKITHTRMQLLKLMEPVEDKSVDTTMMLVVVHDRKDVKPIMDATSFQRILSAPQISDEELPE